MIWMSQSVVEPDIQETGSGTGRWMVVIYNNESNSMDEVIEVLIRATGCDIQEAEIEMWEAHTFGKAPVHFASKPECEDAAIIISSVGIKTEVALEWND
jgi:ATP-dependent Clp protease adaptor protein ClpS